MRIKLLSRLLIAVLVQGHLACWAETTSLNSPTAGPSIPIQASTVAPKSKVKLTPETMGVKLPYDRVSSNTHADQLHINLAMVNDPKQVGQYFDSKMWRKGFLPMYLTVENKGNYPIEVSTGNILLLEEKDPLKTTKTSTSSRSKKNKNLPPFIAPMPPGIVFNKTKHVQYGWKSNLGMIALTGLTFGFAAPVTVPAMVVGNMHRGTNKRVASSFQDQSLSRMTIEPGDKASTWLFYKRVSKKQKLVPKKIVFADIYTPAKEELSALVLDLQPMTGGQVAVLRGPEESETKDVQLYLGKITEETTVEQADDKLKGLDKLGEGNKTTSPDEVKQP